MAKAMGKNVAVSIYGKAKEAIYNAGPEGLRHQRPGAGAHRLYATRRRGHPEGRHIDPLTSEMVDNKGKHKVFPWIRRKYSKKEPWV